MLSTPLAAVSGFSYPANIAAWIPGFAWGVWLPYLIGALVLAIGLIAVRNEFLQKQGLDKIVVLGPVFFAVPLAVFGTEHFTAATILAGMVPAWLPGHMFWALFVGTCLIAAALSIAAGTYAWLASALAGVMILLFVLLIHLPNVVASPHTRLLWVVALREPAFAGGAFALAAAQSGRVETAGEACLRHAGKIFNRHSHRVYGRAAMPASGTRARRPAHQGPRPCGCRRMRSGVT